MRQKLKMYTPMKTTPFIYQNQPRLCLVAVKRFPENTYFPKMLISGKGKYFCVFGCISKNFPENIFWCLERKKENTNLEKHKPQPRKHESRKHKSKKHDCDPRSRSPRRDLAFARFRSTLREIAPSIVISIRRDLTKARSRSTARSHKRRFARSRR